MKESHYDLGMGYCPSYHHAAELVGRRWNGVIIRALLLGATRFTEIADQIPEMSDKMLASRLRELEDEGVVQRTVQPTVPVRVDYSLTEKGQDLHHAIRALAEWADYWMPEESEDWTLSTRAELDRTRPTARAARGNGQRPDGSGSSSRTRSSSPPMAAQTSKASPLPTSARR
jgi:DNA-binding HxlR family transcriptional regulator